MNAERRASIERGVWRGAGVVIALEAVRLLATLPQPKTEAEATRMLGLGILIPMWFMWGETRRLA